METNPTHSDLDARGRARRTVRIAALVTALLVALTGLAACGDDESADDTTTTTAPQDTGSTVAPSEAGDQGGNTVTSQGGGSSNDSATAKPAITAFTTPDNIDCHNGNSQQFSVSWTTTNATKVTISIDGPGIYAEYPANGDTSLPFSCSSSHTFLLTAYGEDGAKATRTVTLEPRNAQPSPNEPTTTEEPAP